MFAASVTTPRRKEAEVVTPDRHGDMRSARKGHAVFTFTCFCSSVTVSPRPEADDIAVRKAGVAVRFTCPPDCLTCVYSSAK